MWAGWFSIIKRYKADIKPARSAPDLQCINAGLLISANSDFASCSMDLLGAARDLAVKSNSVIPALLQASASNCQPPSSLGHVIMVAGN